MYSVASNKKYAGRRIHNLTLTRDTYFSLATQQSHSGLGSFIVDVLRSHTFKHTTPVWLLWMRDRPVAETSTWQQRHWCHQRDSDPQSQQASGNRPTP